MRRGSLLLLILLIMFFAIFAGAMLGRLIRAEPTTTTTTEDGKEQSFKVESSSDPTTTAGHDEDDYDDDPELAEFRKAKKECHDPDAPKVGDTRLIHIPNREHLIPRFHGLRAFSPRDGLYDKKGGKEILEHHHGSKLVYLFDEHEIQGVWPVHAYEHGGRHLKLLVADLYVRKEVLHGEKEETEVCFFKVRITR